MMQRRDGSVVAAKPTRPYGDVFQWDNTALKPGESVAIDCNGWPSTWTPTRPMPFEGI